MGTFGLGLSSSISVWVFLAVQALYYIRGKSEWKFTLKGCRWHDVPEIVKLGYSGSLSRFVEMFRCLIVNFLIIRYVGSVGEYHSSMEPDETGKNVGIRLIYGIAKDVAYQNLLGMNVLTIRI